MIESRVTGHSGLPCTHCLGLWAAWRAAIGRDCFLVPVQIYKWYNLLWLSIYMPLGYIQGSLNGSSKCLPKHEEKYPQFRNILPIWGELPTPLPRVLALTTTRPQGTRINCDFGDLNVVECMTKRTWLGHIVCWWPCTFRSNDICGQSSEFLFKSVWQYCDIGLG